MVRLTRTDNGSGPSETESVNSVRHPFIYQSISTSQLQHRYPHFHPWLLVRFSRILLIPHHRIYIHSFSSRHPIRKQQRHRRLLQTHKFLLPRRHPRQHQLLFRLRSRARRRSPNSAHLHRRYPHRRSSHSRQPPRAPRPVHDDGPGTATPAKCPPGRRCSSTR